MYTLQVENGGLATCLTQHEVAEGICLLTGHFVPKSRVIYPSLIPVVLRPVSANVALHRSYPVVCHRLDLIYG